MVDGIKVRVLGGDQILPFLSFLPLHRVPRDTQTHTANGKVSAVLLHQEPYWYLESQFRALVNTHDLGSGKTDSLPPLTL